MFATSQSPYPTEVRAACLPTPLREAIRSLRRLGLRCHPIDRPRQHVRPIDFVDRRGLIDAIAPAEDVLDWQQDEVRSRVEHEIQHAIADGRVEQRASRSRIDAALPEQEIPTRPRAARYRESRSSRLNSADTSSARHGSQRSTLYPGSPSRAIDSRTKSGTVPRSSTLTSAPVSIMMRMTISPS